MAARAMLICVIVFFCKADLNAGNDCIPFSEANAHIGESKCVSGKVVRVESRSGVYFLDFCDDYQACSFTGVVFARDLRQVGDVRQLTGKVIHLHGTVKQYDGRAEIVISRPSQLGAEGGRIPPLPKGFDVENKGRYSAGKFGYPSSSSATKRKRASKSSDLQGRTDVEQD